MERVEGLRPVAAEVVVVAAAARISADSISRLRLAPPAAASPSPGHSQRRWHPTQQRLRSCSSCAAGWTSSSGTRSSARRSARRCANASSARRRSSGSGTPWSATSARSANRYVAVGGRRSTVGASGGVVRPDRRGHRVTRPRRFAGTTGHRGPALRQRAHARPPTRQAGPPQVANATARRRGNCSRHGAEENGQGVRAGEVVCCGSAAQRDEGCMFLCVCERLFCRSTGSQGKQAPGTAAALVGGSFPSSLHFVDSTAPWPPPRDPRPSWWRCELPPVGFFAMESVGERGDRTAASSRSTADALVFVVAQICENQWRHGERWRDEPTPAARSVTQPERDNRDGNEEGSQISVVRPCAGQPLAHILVRDLAGNPDRAAPGPTPRARRSATP